MHALVTALLVWFIVAALFIGFIAGASHQPRKRRGGK